MDAPEFESTRIALLSRLRVNDGALETVQEQGTRIVSFVSAVRSDGEHLEEKGGKVASLFPPLPEPIPFALTVESDARGCVVAPPLVALTADIPDS